MNGKQIDVIIIDDPHPSRKHDTTKIFYGRESGKCKVQDQEVQGMRRTDLLRRWYAVVRKACPYFGRGTSRKYRAWNPDNQPQKGDWLRLALRKLPKSE